MIAASILVHEHPETVVDQVLNFRRFTSLCPCLHLSGALFEHRDDLAKELRRAGVDNVIINPKSLATQWGNIIDAHMSNIDCILAHGGFHKIAFHSSNDMYVRRGADDRMTECDALLNLRPAFATSRWWPAREAMVDSELGAMLKELHLSEIYGGQVEGSMYRTDVLQEIIGVIRKKRPLYHNTPFYPREEFYFVSLAHAFSTGWKIGTPVIFSEVHRYDRLQDAGSEPRIRFSENMLRWLTSSLRRRYHRFVAKRASWRISLRDIEAIRACDIDYLRDNSWIDDGRGRFQFYDEGKLFGVKRVSRNYSDPIRTYIRALPA